MLVLVPALSWLEGCATPKAFSYLDGERWNRAEMNTFDTLIVSVDGKSYPYNSRIMVDPGRHRIAFRTTPTAGFAFSPEKTLDIDIEPCMRYWFEAKRANVLAQDYEPRVNYKEPLAGCGVASNSAAGYRTVAWSEWTVPGRDLLNGPMTAESATRDS
jgi:hypothetical protein